MAGRFPEGLLIQITNFTHALNRNCCVRLPQTHTGSDIQELPPTKHGDLLNLLATPVTLCKGWQSGSNIQELPQIKQERSFAKRTRLAMHQCYDICTCGGCNNVTAIATQ